MIELFGCVGLHWILKYGSILNLPRKYITRIPIIDRLFKCSLCLGFWSSVIIYIITLDNICIIFAGAGACWFFDNINNLVQRSEIKLENSSK